MATPTPSMQTEDASTQTPAWKRKAKAHRAHQTSLIPLAWRLPLTAIPSAQEVPSAIDFITQSCTEILSPLELEITHVSTTAFTILTNIRSQTWSSLQVTTAFAKRASILHQLTGCLTEIMFDSALKRAAELDAYLAATGKTVGPLHGLPLSLKDNHDVEGVDSTVGWVGLIGKPAASDAPTVEAYRGLGAVLYLKTNVPQSLMMSDSYNYVYGQCVNSLNRNLISGGSSGGEGALVGGGGSVIGVGTDIGGSVRIPATLQGLYGLSPTVGRVGNRESIRSQKYMCLPVAGPLGRHLEDVETFMKATLSEDVRPWEKDPCILPIPWRNQEVGLWSQKGKKMKFGYVVDDGMILPQPPVQRAVKEVVEKLKQAGHEVVEWDASSHSHKEGYDLWLKAVLADGGQKCKDLCQLADEPLIPGMLVGQPKDFLDNAQRQKLADDIFDYQRRYLRRWAQEGLDALIMPVTQWAGMKPREWVKADMYVGYTSIANLLNWTALAIPATKVSRKLDQPDEVWRNHEPRSISDKFNHNAYDIDLVDGMPVGVQIITGRFGEEKAFGIAKAIAALDKI